MRRGLLLVAFLLVALALGTGVLRVSAQAPTNTYPGGAIGVDNQFHFIPASTRLWYFFEYAGDNSQFSVVLVNGAKDRLDFNLYLPTQVTLPDQFVSNPIGRGSQPGITCPAGAGDCDANNKIWLGPSRIPGRYYVEVINNNPHGIAFLLRVTGTGSSIALHPPTATPLPTNTNTPGRVAAAQATATPHVILTVMAQVAATLKAPLPGETPQPTSSPQAAATPTAIIVAEPGPSPTPDNFYWQTAIYVIDDRLRVIPPKADHWFRFDYGGDRSQIRIRLPDARLSALSFKVYTHEQVLTYEREDRAVGVGSPPIVACEDGRCSSTDLIWIGAFNTSGLYFVRVTNESNVYANYRLIVSGSNVSLGR